MEEHCLILVYPSRSYPNPEVVVPAYNTEPYLGMSTARYICTFQRHPNQPIFTLVLQLFNHNIPFFIAIRLLFFRSAPFTPA